MDHIRETISGLFFRPRRAAPLKARLPDPSPSAGDEHMFSGPRREGKPEMIFSCPPRYARRYETLCGTHLIRSRAEGRSREDLDWYARRRLQGARLIVMAESDAKADVEAAIATATRTGARRVIVGPSMRGDAHNAIVADRDIRNALHDKSLPEALVYGTPTGATKEEYLECCNEMVRNYIRGMCVSPFVPLHVFDALLADMASPPDVIHAHNPFADPFEVADYSHRRYSWLDSFSTDAPFRAARLGRRYTDGVTGSVGYSSETYKRWAGEYEDYPLRREELEDADWNHMQLLRFMSGYIGRVPGYGERVAGRRELR